MEPTGEIPTSEQPPVESSKPEAIESSKSEVDKAKEDIRQFIEGEPMGSVKSKAFCDSVDIFVARQKSKDYPEDKVYAAQEASIGETVRQRTNELPGYLTEYYKAIDLGVVLQKTMSDKAKGRFDEKVLNHQVSYELGTLKMDYLQAASKTSQSGSQD